MAMGVQSEERASSASTALEMMKADVGSPAKKLKTNRTFVLYKQILCSKHHVRWMIFATHACRHLHAGTCTEIFQENVCHMTYILHSWRSSVTTTVESDLTALFLNQTKGWITHEQQTSLTETAIVLAAANSGIHFLHFFFFSSTQP